MGGAGGCGASEPVGAVGAGAGSGIATGIGGGGNVGALATAFFTGVGGAGGGGGATFGLGGSMNSDRIATGTTTSIARCSRPDWMAHKAATWKSTTPPAMAALRLIIGVGRGLLDEDISDGQSQYRPVAEKSLLLAENPPDRNNDQYQAAAKGCDEFHALLSVMDVAS